MEKGEIEDICRKIYSKHKKALDLIFDYRPDLELTVSEYLAEMLVNFDLIKFLEKRLTYTLLQIYWTGKLRN